MHISSQPCRNAANAGTSVDGLALREIFGQFASGVTVITSGAKGSVNGMTANAFMSVSLDPALVLISLKNDSYMRNVIDAEGRFGVSILADGQQSVSDHFAGRLEDDTAAKFDHPGDTPVVAGALAWIACSVEQRHIAGDHTLFIANVDDFLQSAGAPLLFFGGQYRTLSEGALS
jgi:flavin reductase (DIM6/NTAB) family NADH-FMN oxidoreductase RutF